jgi:hypothetical protein
MADCKNCKRTDVKCCPTCGRKGTNCDVWHRCGEDCPGYDEPPKQTNADRIRAMSDEELAEFINMVANDSIDTMVGYKDYTEIWEDKEPTLQWLKSEAKE